MSGDHVTSVETVLCPEDILTYPWLWYGINFLAAQHWMMLFCQFWENLVVFFSSSCRSPWPSWLWSPRPSPRPPPSGSCPGLSRPCPGRRLCRHPLLSWRDDHGDHGDHSRHVHIRIHSCRSLSCIAWPVNKVINQFIMLYCIQWLLISQTCPCSYLSGKEVDEETEDGSSNNDGGPIGGQGHIHRQQICNKEN